MADLSTIARPYAKAVFELAQSNGTLELWSSALEFFSGVANNERVQAIVADPATGDGQVLALFDEVAADHMNAECKNFIRLIVENGRVAALPDIAVLFDELKAAAQNVTDVTVTSVEPVTDEHRSRLTESLRQKLGSDVRLHFAQDASLLGGALIEAGDLVIDGTVRGRLEKLTGALAD